MLPFHRNILSQTPRFHSRFLASIADTVAPAPYQIFDRYAKVLQKDRSAVPTRVENSRTVDYVRDEIAGRLIERMLVSTNPWSFFVYLNASCVRISSGNSIPCWIWGPAQVTSRNYWRLERHRRSSCSIRAVRLHFSFMHRLLKDV